MLKIYGFDLSVPVIKVKLCANALNLDYENVLVNLPKGEHKQEQYLAIHPAGKVPAIEDDEQVLFESNAIMKYLCRKHHSSYYPEGIIEQAEVDQWCDFIALHVGTAYSRVLYNKIIAPQFNLAVDEQSLKDGLTFIDRFLPIIEQQLSKTKYMASNNVTIADFCLLATLEPSEVIEIDLTPYPNIQQWRKQMRAQKFYTDIHQAYGQEMAVSN